MFVNVIFGGGLDFKSSDNFSIYVFEIILIRLEVGENFGVRFELKRKIEWEYLEFLFFVVLINYFILCVNYMFVRITEYLFILRVMSCFNEGVVSNDKSVTLIKLLLNINIRGVRGGYF